MAIDSANKRASAGNLPWMDLPIPDGGITSSDQMMMGGEYMVHPWVSAGSVTLSTGWDDPDNAIDGNTGTFAKEQAGAQTPLELEWTTTVWTDMIRVFAHDEDIIAGTHDASNVKIQLWINGAWYTLGSNFTLSEDEWYEYPIGQKIWGDIARITSLDTEEYLCVADFQFLNLNETLPDAAIPKVGGGLVRNPLLGSGMVT